MAPLLDPERLRCYKNALANWKYSGYILYKEVALKWLLEEYKCYRIDEFSRIMYEFVDSGGPIDEQPERRHEWSDSEFHYDLRIPIKGRIIYFETLLQYNKPDDPDDPWITVVSAHDR